MLLVGLSEWQRFGFVWISPSFLWMMLRAGIRRERWVTRSAGPPRRTGISRRSRPSGPQWTSWACRKCNLMSFLKAFFSPVLKSSRISRSSVVSEKPKRRSLRATHLFNACMRPRSLTCIKLSQPQKEAKVFPSETFFNSVQHAFQLTWVGPFCYLAASDLKNISQFQDTQHQFPSFTRTSNDITGDLLMLQGLKGPPGPPGAGGERGPRVSITFASSWEFIIHQNGLWCGYFLLAVVMFGAEHFLVLWQGLPGEGGAGGPPGPPGPTVGCPCKMIFLSLKRKLSGKYHG